MIKIIKMGLEVYKDGMKTRTAAVHVGVSVSTLQRNLRPLKDKEGNILKKDHQYLYDWKDVFLYGMKTKRLLSNEQFKRTSQFADILDKSDFELLNRECVYTDEAANYLVEYEGVSEKTASQHLGILAQKGLLKREKRGRSFMYSAPHLVLNKINYWLRGLERPNQLRRPWQLSDEVKGLIYSLAVKSEGLGTLIDKIKEKKELLRGNLEKKLGELGIRRFIAIKEDPIKTINYVSPSEEVLDVKGIVEGFGIAELYRSDAVKVIIPKEYLDKLKEYLVRKVNEDIERLGDGKAKLEEIVKPWPDSKKAEKIYQEGLENSDEFPVRVGEFIEKVINFYTTEKIKEPRLNVNLSDKKKRDLELEADGKMKNIEG